MRNNSVVKDVELDYRESNSKRGVKRKYACWDHIENAFDMDQQSDSLHKFMPEIKEEHVRLNKLKKMKVSVCTQTLSETMATFINHAVNLGGIILNLKIVIHFKLFFI